jgi:hypothetical protein
LAICTLCLAALIALPLRTGKIRLAIVGLLALVWGGLIVLTAVRKWWVGAGLAAITLAVGIFICLPGAPINVAELRSLYLERLQRYTGVIYVYGGENSLGIDCSGLVRRAMVDALFLYGVRKHDSAAIRAACRLWWCDANAIELGNGAHGDTRAVGASASVKLGDHPDAVPGDMAVTASGSHVLAYLGGEQWIEAEPNVGRTHVFTLTGSFQGLASEHVKFVRWKWLAGNP